jgi:hypothetical protein
MPLKRRSRLYIGNSPPICFQPLLSYAHQPLLRARCWVVRHAHISRYL